jgi:hypothetical protein
VITWGIAIVGSFVLLKLVDAITGLRVNEADEYDGLDLSQHGESGYNLEDAFGGSYEGSESTVARENAAAHASATASAV